MPNASLHDLLVADLKYLYFADRQLQKAFPLFAKAAHSESLKRLCREGVDYSAERLRRLETAFEVLGTNARAKTSHGMRGLLEEAEEVAQKKLPPEVKDAALLASIQRIAHYGIAAYGTAAAYANAVGEKKVAKVLVKSLQEKKDADVEMTEMAESEINPRAMDGEAG